MRARIMVIEDDADCRGLVEALLSSAGYEVVCAATGVEALGMTYNVRPDLIVLDLGLPDVSGHEVARHVTSDWHAFDVPIIVLSALTGDQDHFLARCSGIQDYIEKPFSCGELLDRVRDRLAPDRTRDGRWWFKEQVS